MDKEDYQEIMKNEAMAIGLTEDEAENAVEEYEELNN